MKLKKEAIGLETLEEYLSDASDFAFELRVLRMLVGKGIPCEHGGQYQDPDTKKFREFDIRARITKGNITCHAAIECKSIGDHFPLLVSCVPRSMTEAVHNVFFYDPAKVNGYPLNLGILEANQVVVAKPSQIYPEAEAVGKSTAQVGRRDSKDGELVANDADFFDKWSQALQSLDDLIGEIADRNFIQKISNGQPHVATALPIVVIPDGTLWASDYAADGSRTEPPRQVDNVSIYIGRSYTGRLPHYEFAVSHLEVKTETGLARFCDELLANEQTMKKFVRRD